MTVLLAEEGQRRRRRADGESVGNRETVGVSQQYGKQAAAG
jgi:hypothetical protein